MQVLRPVLAAATFAALLAASAPSNAQDASSLELAGAQYDFDPPATTTTMVSYVRSAQRPDIAVICRWHNTDDDLIWYMGRVMYQGNSVSGHYPTTAAQKFKAVEAMHLESMGYDATASATGFGQRSEDGIGDARSSAKVPLVGTAAKILFVEGQTTSSKLRYAETANGHDLIIVRRNYAAGTEIRFAGVEATLDARSSAGSPTTMRTTAGSAEAVGRSWAGYDIAYFSAGSPQ